MNVLKPHLQSTVFTLLERNKSQRQIERLTGIDRKTIRRYQAIFEAEKSAAANSPTATTGTEAPVTQTPPPPRPPATADSSKATTFNFARSASEPHREWIEQQVRLRRNAQAIYQDLVDQFGFAASYESVKRFVRALRHIDPEQFDRLEFAPGEEAQVDYGEGALTRDPKTGRYRRPRLFVMTLRYSRRSFRRVVWKSSKQVWAQLHEEAFRYFGGSVSYVVLDNLREGVITPDLYEPEINRLYEAMLEHYGVVADPARVRDPNRKGSVENAIQHTQGTALAGRRFESLEAQNEFLIHWEANWAAKRIHGSTRRQVEAMFQEVRPHLRPLPTTGFRYFTEVVRTVWDDTTVNIDRSNYAARPAPIGSLVSVRIYDSTIEIRDRRTQALLRTHPRALQAGSLELPEDERPFNPSRQSAFLLASAGDIGPQTKALCQHMFDSEARVGHRAMWGIVGLAKKYPARLVEQACDHALRHHVYRYKQVRAIVERLFEQALERLDQAPQLELPLTQDHPLIRPAAEYGELFTLGAQHGAESQQPTGRNTGMTMTLPEIERALGQLRLSGVRDTLETRVLQAQGCQQPFLETFALILQDELDRRQSRLIERRYKLSSLEEKLTLAEFDWGFNPKVPRQACFQLHTLKFIAAGDNALIIGKPGTGKSHVAKAVAYQAVLQGHKVQYLETDDFFNRYALSPTAQREARLRAILECDLLVLDDLFLSRTIPDAAGALLQTLIHQRYKLHRSVLVTSNRVVQDWGAYLGDNTMSTTILDRLMHHCHLLEFDGRSYRLKEAAETLARKAKTS